MQGERAHAPPSVKGAARFGGRWNPIGAATIYAANELSIAWAEYNQGFVQHPALIAQIELPGARHLPGMSGYGLPTFSKFSYVLPIIASGGCLQNQP